MKLTIQDKILINGIWRNPDLVEQLKEGHKCSGIVERLRKDITLAWDCDLRNYLGSKGFVAFTKAIQEGYSAEDRDELQNWEKNPEVDLFVTLNTSWEDERHMDAKLWVGEPDLSDYTRAASWEIGILAPYQHNLKRNWTSGLIQAPNLDPTGENYIKQELGLMKLPECVEFGLYNPTSHDKIAATERDLMNRTMYLYELRK